MQKIEVDDFGVVTTRTKSESNLTPLMGPNTHEEEYDDAKINKSQFGTHDTMDST